MSKFPFKQFGRVRNGSSPHLPAILIWFVLVWTGTGLAAGQGAETSGLSVLRGQSIPVDAKHGLGSWIWTDKTFDRQSCRLWKEFEIPARAKVVSARMRMTVDNGYRLFVDGRELGRGADWRGITEYHLAELLEPGRHVLAVDAFNDYFNAGLILALDIVLEDGRTLEVKSDASWRVVPEHVRDWEQLKHADRAWRQATIIPTHTVSQWTDSTWPYDYVTVPAFQPVVVPFWQKPAFHIGLISTSILAFLACITLLIRLAIHSKEQHLLNLERARIARDIHDDFGTRLTGLVLEGEVIKSELQGNASSRERLERISNGLREALGAMDEVLWAVNPRRDTVTDFVTYLCEHAQSFLKPARIQCLLEIQPHMPPLSFDLPLRRSLLLAVKEAINNVVKHSGASRMTLHISYEEPNVVVVVEDNGRGFEDNRAGAGRNGLANMVQRMTEVGGECHVSSEPGSGCRIEFRMPPTRRRPRFSWLFRAARNRRRPPSADSSSQAADRCCADPNEAPEQP